jgi:hypothetical protein
MVMLASRDIPGEQMYLFAPDPGVPARRRTPSTSRASRTAPAPCWSAAPSPSSRRARTSARACSRPLPDAATTTIPFALERALAVEHSGTAVGGRGRAARPMQRETLTIERYNVQRTTYACATAGPRRPA